MNKERTIMPHKKSTVYTIFMHSLLVGLLWFLMGNVHAAVDNDPQSDAQEESSALFDTNTKIMYLNYKQEPLVSIINVLSELKGVNVILPQGANEIKSTITLNVTNPMTVTEAWDYLATILDIAGFALTQQSDDSYMIVKREKQVLSTPTSLYIGVSPLDLPKTDEYIRYLYYFSNIKVSSSSDQIGVGAKDEVSALLQEILGSGTSVQTPFGQQTQSGSSNTLFKVDPVSNSLLVVAKSNQIRELMSIIIELDQTQFQEKMEFLELQFADATIVANLFSTSILQAQNSLNRYRLDTRRVPDNAYFSPHARIIPIKHRNAILILGRAQAVERIRDFIIDNIDLEPRTGKSVLHVYQLQYLDADSLVKVLQKVVETSSKSPKPASEFAQSAAGEAEANTERLFDEVIIMSDKPVEGKKGERMYRFPGTRDVPEGSHPEIEEATEQVYFGGNKLIVACRSDDWVEIKRLIESLDTPQPQVLLEVLIADLTIDDTRQLGALTRNPAKLPILNTMSFQSGMFPLGSDGLTGVIPNSWSYPTTVASDLLRYAFDADGKPTDGTTSDPAVNSAAAFFKPPYGPPGSGLISLNDNNGETWSLLQFLKSFAHAKILSHPHVVAVNNKTAIVSLGEERRLPDEASGALGGTTMRQIKKINANLTVEVTPLITSPETVNLQILVKVEDFIGANNNTKSIRSIKTNATIRNNAIWALGGLVRVANAESMNDTPLLSKVPIIGKFFSRQSEDAVKNNLTVLITPTIIEPRLRHGMGPYTKDYLDMAKMYAREGSVFDQRRNDPINRWFFQAGADLEGTLDAFSKQEPLPLGMYRPTVPQRKKKAQKPVLEDTQPEYVPDPKREFSRKPNEADPESSIIVVQDQTRKNESQELLVEDAAITVALADEADAERSIIVAQDQTRKNESEELFMEDATTTVTLADLVKDDPNPFLVKLNS